MVHPYPEAEVSKASTKWAHSSNIYDLLHLRLLAYQISPSQYAKVVNICLLLY